MGSYEWMELQTLTSEIAASRSRLVAARSKRDHGRTRALEEEIAAAELRRDRLLAYISTNLASVPENAQPPAGLEGAKLREALESAAAAQGPAPDDIAGERRAAKPPGRGAVPAAANGQDEAAEELPPPEPAAALAAEEPAPAEVVAARPAPEAGEGLGAAAAENARLAAAEGGQPPAEVADRSPDTLIATGAAAAPTADSTGGGFMAWDQLTPGDIDRAKHEIGMRRVEMLARHAEELKALEADQAQLETLEQAIAAFAAKFAKAGVVKLDEQRELRQQGA